MPNRNAPLLAVAAFAALAACNSNYNINNLYGSATATPTATPTTTANPSDTTANVGVTVSGNVPTTPVVVNVFNSTTTGNIVNPNSPPLYSQTTNSSGQVQFTNLTGAQWYCFQATLTYATPPPSGTLTPTQTDCTNLWGTLGVQLRF